MSSIDERIVKMTFDNSDFEGKISKTLQSLEKLNETLSKTSAADGLKEVSKALKEVQAQVSGMNFETEDIIDSNNMNYYSAKQYEDYYVLVDDYDNEVFTLSE